MTKLEIEKGLSYLKSLVKSLGLHPGHIIKKSNILIQSIATETSWSNKEATCFVNLLICNQLIEYDGIFIKLSSKGYSYFYDAVEEPLTLDLNFLVPCNDVKREQAFYYLWDIVGNDKTENPYYSDGKTFYDTAIKFLRGYPSTYSQFISHRKDQGLETSRHSWCKELFDKIPDSELQVFLTRLSDKINANILNALIANDIHDELHKIKIDRKNSNVTQMTNKPKIFISHNTMDKDYAKAIVDLLIALGVNEEEDVFCNSIPGCGVKLGSDFLDAIKNQFMDNELIMLYIHSPRYYQSHISLCEMGASWVMQTRHYSFLTKDCDASMLDAVVKPTEIAFKAGPDGNPSVLNDFKEIIEKIFNLKFVSITKWDRIKNDFIQKVS